MGSGPPATGGSAVDQIARLTALDEWNSLGLREVFLKRRVFLGAAGLGAVAATVGSAQNLESEEEDYRIRPTVSFGLGRGEAASMSVVWLPAQGREKLPPIKVVLVIFRLDGEVFRPEANCGRSEDFVEFVRRHPPAPGRRSGSGRAALERRTVHIPDVFADPDYAHPAGSAAGPAS